jgi:hypothetical protein
MALVLTAPMNGLHSPQGSSRTASATGDTPNTKHAEIVAQQHWMSRMCTVYTTPGRTPWGPPPPGLTGLPHTSAELVTSTVELFQRSTLHTREATVLRPSRPTDLPTRLTPCLCRSNRSNRSNRLRRISSSDIDVLSAASPSSLSSSPPAPAAPVPAPRVPAASLPVPSRLPAALPAWRRGVAAAEDGAHHAPPPRSCCTRQESDMRTAGRRGMVDS